jgi:transposase/AraC-like DNA-binding protein
MSNDDFNPPALSNSHLLNDTGRQRVFCVEAYWAFRRSCKLVRACYRRVFGREHASDNRHILNQVYKFHLKGSIKDDRKGKAGRKRQYSDETVKKVDEFITEHPTCGQREAAQRLGISRSTLQRIVKKRLKMHPYKIQMYQRLSDYDKRRRLDFANAVLILIDEGKLDVNKIWFSDECHFWLDGYVNKQNYRFWAKENPYISRTTPLHPKKLTVWAALCDREVAGPNFFREGTITGDSYLRMLEDKFIPEAYGHDMVNGYTYMQDGATPHRTAEVFECLAEHFGSRVIGLDYPGWYGEGLEWPPYSPDLNPCDFFLWGYIKDRVYKDNPKTLDELEEKIVYEIRNIPRTILRKIGENFVKRLRKVVEAEGGHIEQFMT